MRCLAKASCLDICSPSGRRCPGTFHARNLGVLGVSIIIGLNSQKSTLWGCSLEVLVEIGGGPGSALRVLFLLNRGLPGASLVSLRALGSIPQSTPNSQSTPGSTFKVSRKVTPKEIRRPKKVNFLEFGIVCNRAGPIQLTLRSG